MYTTQYSAINSVEEPNSRNSNEFHYYLHAEVLYVMGYNGRNSPGVITSEINVLGMDGDAKQQPGNINIFSY